MVARFATSLCQYGADYVAKGRRDRIATEYVEFLRLEWSSRPLPGGKLLARHDLPGNIEDVIWCGGLCS